MLPCWQKISLIFLLCCANGCVFVENKTPSAHHQQNTPSFTFPSKQGTVKGFPNTQNNSFINANLQVIFNDSLLSQAIIDGAINAQAAIHPSNQQKLLKKHAYEDFVALSLDYHDPNIHLLNSPDTIRYILTQTKPNRQEDAAEFLMCLINLIQHTTFPHLFTQCTQKTQWQRSPQPTTKHPHPNKKYDTMPQDDITQTTTPLQFLLHTLPVPPSSQQGTNPITQLFSWQSIPQGEAGPALFMKNGVLEGFIPINTQIATTSSPQRCVFQALRFIQNPITHAWEKNTNPLHIPEKFKLQHSHYSLSAFITHTGTSLHQGHYKAFIKHHHGIWYCCDDQNIIKIARKDLEKEIEQGYLYFYAQNG